MSIRPNASTKTPNAARSLALTIAGDCWNDEIVTYVAYTLLATLDAHDFNRAALSQATDALGRLVTTYDRQYAD